MKKKGFTLIEVALVLAIAGLIFMMVFITLPQVWRSQRDAQRRDDMMTFVQRLKNFQTNNNRGALPSGSGLIEGEKVAADRTKVKNGVSRTDAALNYSGMTGWGGFYRDFFDDNYTDPVGEYYNLMVVACKNATLDGDCGTTANLSDAEFPNDYNIYVVTGAKCDGEKAVGSANTRKVAVLYKLEGGGVYCGES